MLSQNLFRMQIFEQEEGSMDWAAREQLVQAQKAAVSANGDGVFFNRQKELQALLSRLAIPPACVTMVIGPNDCGKSKLLQALEKMWSAKEELAAISPIFYFDIRNESWETPKDAALVVSQKLRTWVSVFTEWIGKVKEGLASVTIKKVGGGVGADVALKAVVALLPVCDQAETSGLSKVMTSFSGVLTSGKVAPIFILDEVNLLKAWEKAALDRFVGFFKSMVKQNKKAYLILSTSDDLFRVWLREMFTEAQWEPFGVGYFPEAEAKRYFVGHAMAAVAGFNGPTSFQDAEWKAIYAACGGSPLLLDQCARLAALNGMSWQQAADAQVRSCVDSVDAGLAATQEGMGFSGDNYEKICQQIVAHGFLGVNAARKNIYKEDKTACRSELKAMHKHKCIHIRFVTAGTLYGDVSISDAGEEVDLIMARSPAHRAAMKLTIAATIP